MAFEFAAAAAKSLQSCPTLCNPIDGSPSGSWGILQARTLEWVAISFSNAWQWKVKVNSLSRVQLLATPWTAAHQASLSMGFSRQEHRSGLPFPSPGELSNPGIEPTSYALAGQFFSTVPRGKSKQVLGTFYYMDAGAGHRRLPLITLSFYIHFHSLSYTH